MILTRHAVDDRTVWAVDGRALPEEVALSDLLALPAAEMRERLRGGTPAVGDLLAPCDPQHEIWASGVTYLRSRQEREAESSVADVYGRVYEAERPEIFFKAIGWRVVGHGGAIRVRQDSDWNVPEPELTLVVNRFGEIVGYTAGNDVSSRRIEGENPLYLPQAKTYDGACALGPGIVLASEAELEDLRIRLEIERQGARVFEGASGVAMMKRSLLELVNYLFREITFPHGAFLMTGTGIVPAHPFTLQGGDEVRITVGALTLENVVA
ncbi:MAG: fumarylacetoacetate hydrolase family protein [Fimbriimonas sp.]